jgi:hypothetical protein
VCTHCENNEHCAHIEGKRVCDKEMGACVECTIATELDACRGKSCNPATNTCTATNVGSLANCEPCVADSECAGGDQEDPDRRCVPLEYDGARRPGGFCLKRVSKTCVVPYTIGVVAESLSGAPAETYCGINQNSVRCEAVLDLVNSTTCGDGTDAECGCTRDGDGLCTEAGKGGLCRDFVTLNNRCTYACGVAQHCPLGLTCPSGFCQ